MNLPGPASHKTLTPYYQTAGATFYVGDAVNVLRGLPNDSVHCCVTSPPYWGLRDYGLEPVIWGGSARCHHRWLEVLQPAANGLVNSPMTGDTLNAKAATRTVKLSGSCPRCGAWRGQLGLEPTPELYVSHLAEVFREVRRVLRDDGTLWLNLGDCYATGGGKVATAPGGGEQGARWSGYRGTRGESNKHSAGAIGPLTQPNRLSIAGLKPKDLVGIPWRAAFALQADGWYLRSDIVWSKPNPLPESVRDRPTKSHEYLFLLTKRERYYYDQVALMEPCASGPSAVRKMLNGVPRVGGKHLASADRRLKVSRLTAIGRLHAVGSPAGRNRRSVWHIATAPFSGAHFATFPGELVGPCILAGTSEAGCCLRCQKPWSRRTSTSYSNPGHRSTNGPRSLSRRSETPGFSSRLEKQVETLGWQPACHCRQRRVPCVVLDPFAGAGTTNLVAQELGRQSIYIDIKEEYAQMARQRLRPAAHRAAGHR